MSIGAKNNPVINTEDHMQYRPSGLYWSKTDKEHDMEQEYHIPLILYMYLI